MKILLEQGMVSEATARSSTRNSLKEKIDSAKENPKRFALNTPIKDLVEFMQHLDDLYHNEGKPAVSDRVYDKLWETLAERQPSHPYLRKVGSAPAARASRSKVKLPYNLPSLSKIHPNTSQSASWYKTPVKSKSWVVSDKLDGVSLLLVYSGSGVSAYTRGDSSVGQNVSSIVSRIKNIPRLSRDSIAVRGELIIEKGIFEKTYSKDSIGVEGFTSARSLVVGTVNRLEQSSALKDFKFIAYELVDPDGKSPEDQLDYLDRKGFTVVNYKVITSISDSVLSGILESRKRTSKFDIDGIVVTRNDPYRRTTADRPVYSIAFKDNAHTEHKTATVTDVIWRSTRTGVLAPRVAVTPVGLGGASVTYFSGFNAYFIEHGYPYKDRDKPENKGKKFPIGPGAKLDVVKSGDVIPFIVRVIKPASKPCMPSVPYNYDSTRINIVARMGRTGSSESSKEMAAAAHLHFLKTIGVTDVGVGFCKKLVDNKITTVDGLLKLPKSDFETRLGLTLVTSAKLHKAIHDSVKSVPLSVLGDASDSFGRGIGRQKLDDLFSAVPSILSAKMDTVADKNRLLGKISSLPGFSEITAQQVLDGLPKFKKFVQSVGRGLVAQAPRRASSGPASNMVVLFSKIRDKALELDILKKGGKVASSLRSDVTHLVVKDTSDTSSKIEGARAKNIPILTLDRFKAKYGF